MNWTDVSTHPTKPMLRQFAAAWLIFVSAWGMYVWFGRGRPQWGIVLLVLAGTVGAAGLIRPNSVRWLFSTLMIVAFPIGWIVSQLMLLLMFYGIITPIALVFKLLGRDSLSRKLRPGCASFWVAKNNPPDVLRYFRQY